MTDVLLYDLLCLLRSLTLSRLSTNRTLAASTVTFPSYSRHTRLPGVPMFIYSVPIPTPGGAVNGAGCTRATAGFVQRSTSHSVLSHPQPSTSHPVRLMVLKQTEITNFFRPTALPTTYP